MGIEVGFELERVGGNGDLHFVRRKETEGKLAPMWLFMGQGEGAA